MSNARSLTRSEPRFLEWRIGDAWEPLCDALGRPVPDDAFPVTNTTAEFRAQNGLDLASSE